MDGLMSDSATVNVWQNVCPVFVNYHSLTLESVRLISDTVQ